MFTGGRIISLGVGFALSWRYPDTLSTIGGKAKRVLRFMSKKKGGQCRPVLVRRSAVTRSLTQVGFAFWFQEGDEAEGVGCVPVIVRDRDPDAFLWRSAPDAIDLNSHINATRRPSLLAVVVLGGDQEGEGNCLP